MRAEKKTVISARKKQDEEIRGRWSEKDETRREVSRRFAELKAE